MTDSEYYILLRKGVLLHCGIDEINDEGCKVISVQVFERDQNYISLSNIKRFFGLLPVANEFSPFVLNSLSQFIGYDHWFDFKEKQIL